MEREPNFEQMTEHEPTGSIGEEKDEDLLLQELSKFRRTETEQFDETNQILQSFENQIKEKFSGEDLKKIQDALMLMLSLHMYQKDRPEGSPYVSHPLKVAEKVLNMSAESDADSVIAALMHDAVEDQGDKLASLYGQTPEGLSQEQIALLEVQTKYGEKVGQIVNHLSNPDFDAVLAERGVKKDDPEYKNLKNQLYAEHVSEAIEDPEVLRIKLADFSENALNLSKLPTETDEQKAQKQKFVKKYLPVIRIFADKLGQTGEFPDYKERLESEFVKLSQEQ